MGAIRVEDAQLTGAVAERDQILAEELDAQGWAIARCELVREESWHPEATEQLARGCPRPGLGEELVVFFTEHCRPPSMLVCVGLSRPIPYHSASRPEIDGGVMASPAPSYVVIGRPIPRIEGHDKVTGRAVYAADISLPNMLWAVNVRSSFPHARIASVDVSRALHVPGVRAVLTGADFPNVRTGRFLKDQPILCEDRVRFIGDKVAVVAADDREAAEEGAQLVRVEYE